MKQNVIFRVISESGEEIEAIEAKVEWGEDREPTQDFFDRNTGYSGKSSAFGSQNNWTFQTAENQKIIISLMHTVDNWVDWGDYLSWVDGAEDVFLFKMTGETICTEDGYEILRLDRISS